MPSKAASVAVISAGAYGASLAFTSAFSPPALGAPAQLQRILVPSAGSKFGSESTSAFAVSGVLLLAGAGHASMRSAKRGVRVAATQGDDEPAFADGQRVLVLAPPAMAGKQGNVVNAVGDDAFSVRFDSGSVFNIATANMQDAAAPAPAAAPASAAPAMAAPMHVAGHGAGAYDNCEFEEGQRVLVLGPPAMAGKQGTIVGLALGDAYAVQFDSGSVFNFTEANLSANLQGGASDSSLRFKVDAQGGSHVYHNINAAVSGDGACPPDACDLDELEFQPGQRVLVLGPPAMAGKQGTVIGPALGDAFAVRFDSGSEFNILTDFLQDAVGGPAPAAASPVAVAKGAQTTEDDELEFQPGQRVLVLAPPAMAGKQGTVVGPALDAFAIRFDSGSVFNFPAENLQDSASPATAAPAAPVAAARSVATTANEEELEFQPGQNVTVTGPPAMAGKRGAIIGPALGDAFSIRFETGSVFNITTSNIMA